MIRVVDNINCSKTNDANTVLLDEGISLLVVIYGCRLRVEVSVNFDRDLCFRAVEVNHVTPNAVLTSELQSMELSIPKVSPERFFSKTWIEAKFSTEIFVRWVIKRERRHG